MTVSTIDSGARVLLTVDDVRRFKRDLRLTTAAIGRLEAERESLAKKLEAASLFLDVNAIDEAGTEEATTPIPVSSPSRPAGEAVRPPTSGPRQQRVHRSGEPTWKDVVLHCVESADIGVPYAEMRAFALASPLGERLRASDKGYHNSIGRLAREGTIVRRYGRLFTPAAFERFLAAVDKGQASTTIPQPMAHSPMGEAILTIVDSHPGELNGKAVIDELRKNPEFDAALTPHETGAYNIIARLVRREQIVRRDDGLLVPGRNFPRDRGNPPLRNGALNGHAASAPSAGEVAPSPNNDPPSSRLVG